MNYLLQGTSITVLLLGLVTGIAFGLAIFKAGASNYDKILGMLRLKDFTILKFMLTAVITASIGIHILLSLGVISLTLKPVWIFAQIIGGLVFGVGFALLGYCPGTGVIAAGEGKKDAVFGLLGGLVGAAIFAHFWPALKSVVIEPGNMGVHTVSSALSIPVWASVAVLLVVFGGVLTAVELLEKNTRNQG